MLPYDEWQEAWVPEHPLTPTPNKVWINSRYQVNVYLNEAGGNGFPAMHHLSIKRVDKEAIHDWRDLQRIKNDLIGPEHEAMELYPAETRLVDTSNQYHLWVLADPTMRFPLGFTERFVGDGGAGGKDKAKQRPFEKVPDDFVTEAEMDKVVEEELRKKELADLKKYRENKKGG